jgi:predicted transcriptional regulator
MCGGFLFACARRQGKMNWTLMVKGSRNSSAMVTIQLDNAHEERLRALAAGEGRDAAELARRVIEDYLDFQAVSHATPEQWAEASVAMASEFLAPEEWPAQEGDNEPG